MIENSLIVEDTRKIRCAISKKFDNDADKYIDYLILKEDNKQKYDDKPLEKYNERSSIQRCY